MRLNIYPTYPYTLPFTQPQRVGRLSLVLVLFTLLILAGPIHPLWAHEGHNEPESPPTSLSQGLTALAPRFSVSSEDFEVVGIVHQNMMTIYLDDPTNNAPIPNAQIEVESTTTKALAAEIAEGVYQLTHHSLVQPGKQALTLSIQAGSRLDLLAVQLDIPLPTSSPDTAPSPFWLYLPAGILLGLMGVLYRRRSQQNTQAKEII